MSEIELATDLLRSADDWYEKHGFCENAHARTTGALAVIAIECEDADD